MNTLIIYFSINGHCEGLAKRIQSKLQCSIAPIKLKRPLKGFLLYFIGGFESKSKKLRPASIDFDIKNIDKVIIISPVWASSIPSPVRYILNQQSLVNKELTIILSAASGNTAKAESQIHDMFPLSKILGISIDKASPQAIDSLISKI